MISCIKTFWKSNQINQSKCHIQTVWYCWVGIDFSYREGMLTRLIYASMWPPSNACVLGQFKSTFFINLKRKKVPYLLNFWNWERVFQPITSQHFCTCLIIFFLSSPCELDIGSWVSATPPTSPHPTYPQPLPSWINKTNPSCHLVF